MDENNDLELDSADLQPLNEDQPEISDQSPPLPQDFVEEDFVPDDETDDADHGVAPESEQGLQALPLGDELDIDAALASVADLGDMLAERDAAEIAERESIESERRAVEAEAKRRAEHYFPRPPLVEIERGQMASVVPALLLIGLGAWWTFALTTLETPPSFGQMALGIMAVFGIVMIAYWLFSGRWSSGALFGGLTSLLGAGMIFSINQGIVDGDYALLFLAPAIAMLLTALFSARAGQRVGFSAAMLFVIAISAFLISNNVIDNSDELTDIAQLLLPFVGVALLIILALPIVFRRQR